MLNQTVGTGIEVSYFREGQKEVDFVLHQGKTTVAIEVKSSHRKTSLPGLKAFSKAYPNAHQVLVGEHGISIENFLRTNIVTWMRLFA